MSSDPFDPLQLTLIWNRLIAIVEAQAQTLMRCAFSATVREAGDLSAGVFDTKGRMVAQAVTGTPGHVNAMAASVGYFLDALPLDTLRRGDVLVTNDPWLGTGHLNDFTVVTPVFGREAPIALFAATSHLADVGGLGFGPDGRDVFEEGLRVPIMRLFSEGAPNAALFDLIRANVRDPAAAEGDLYSLAGCNDAGAQALIAALDEFGVDDFDAVADAIITRSRDAMHDEVAKVRAGVFRYEMRIDGYDAPIDLKCAVQATLDGLEIDFDGTSPISARGVNVPLTYTQAYASFGARCLIGPNIPNNAGSLGAVKVRAPEGCVLNAPFPAPVSARHVIGQMLPDVVLGALGEARISDCAEAPAEGAACLYLPVIRSLPDDPAPFVINPFHTGGMGARADVDGRSCTAFPSGVSATPVEINEAGSPLIYWRKEYRTDSGGAGRLRGGLGQSIEIEHAAGRAITISKMFDRINHPPRGREGGDPGGAGSVRLAAGDVLAGMGRDVVPSGRFIIETPGGGGYGAPRERDRSELAEDVRNGLVSSDAAVRIYGADASFLASSTKNARNG